MGVFDFLKKKKELPAEEGLTKPETLAGHREVLTQEPAPFGAGITEPSEPSLPKEPSQEPSFPRETKDFARPSLIPQQQPQVQDDKQLILAKLETIKAQLDFLQQKFERIEDYIKQKEDVVRWR